jgi:hypothetical protein
MTTFPLGRVLGLLMDRHASTEAGRATLVHRHDDEGTNEYRLSWHHASVWRVEQGDHGMVCDGRRVQEWRGRKRHAPTAARPRHPAWHLQLVFPLRAHVFGRLGDDYFPSHVRSHDQGVLVTLQGTEDDRQGHLVVDTDQCFIREASFLNGRRTLHLRDLRQGPLDDPDTLFARGCGRWRSGGTPAQRALPGSSATGRRWAIRGMRKCRSSCTASRAPSPSTGV